MMSRFSYHIDVRRRGLRLAVLASAVTAFALPATPAFAGGVCPNEALRSELRSGLLPDCRAYELVTPPYLEGSPLSPEPIFVAADGSSVLAASYGVLPGDEEDELHSRAAGALNGFSRAGSGWSAVPLAFPASTYESQVGVVDASSDSHSTLWQLGRRTTPEAPTSEFYREAPAGVFSLVGPATPSTGPPNEEAHGYWYAGASDDLSHVLFGIFAPEFRWSFDTTLGRGASLYELVGVGNSAPAVVGVLGAAGSTHLVSQCGTRLGSSAPGERFGGGGSMDNAISASGSRVFFTAVGADDVACGGEQPPVDELLVREEDPSGTLSTTSISEPSPSYCTSAPTPPCADARFQGASQDGSKVFFTTAQKLSEGATEGSQNLYEYDFDLPGATQASKLVLVSGAAVPPHVEGVARVSPDGSHLYFVAEGVLSGPNAEGKSPSSAPEARNLYVFERDAAVPDGRTTFIATLSPQDELDWGARDIRPVTVSSDGRFLVFLSVADLTHEGVQPTAAQVFQYDAQTGALVRASIGEHGDNDNDRAPTYAAALGQPAFLAVFDRPGEDGQVLAPRNGAVFFQSPTALTPQALSDKVNAIGRPIENVYEYRAGHVYLISDGKDASSSAATSSVQLLGASASGEDVFFETADALIQQDTNTQLDIYDARAGGGFPTPVAAANCTGDGCQGAPTAAPVFGAPTSATLSGAGNLSPSPSATTGPQPKTAGGRALNSAEKLAIALKACRKKHSRRQRNACERSARKRYPVKTANRHRGRGK
jgi:hypothetical protein